ncbi:MAG TPA: arginase family protein [Anaeromyxobacteraceae bacterium]|nr:arginase family protein [Anaeromyxobacteraceae bacterium]
MSQQSAQEYLAHGQTPFFRLPQAALPAPLPPGTRAALLGVPFDGGATAAPGARFAPFHVRRVSAFVQGWHPVHRVAVFEATGAVDAGNVLFPPFQPAAVRACVEAAALAVHRAGAAPFLVGGDHSIALPALRAAAKAHGPVAVVHVDAHLDTSGPEVWGEPFHHGTPFRHALEEGLIQRGQLHQIGLRGPWGTPDDGALAAAHGAVQVSADAVGTLGAEAVAARLRHAVGDRPVYLSFDVDAVDPAYAPGTGTPAPGGLSSREALALLRGLAGLEVVGMDLVEVCPALDHADLTCHLAAHLLFEGLALVAIAAG